METQTVRKKKKTWQKVLIIIGCVIAGLILVVLIVLLSKMASLSLQAKSLQKNLSMKDSPTAAYSKYLPKTDEIFSYAKDLVNMGPRRPGYPGWKKANAYVTQKFKSFGLSNVQTVPSKTTSWKCSSQSLTVGGHKIPTYYMGHTFNQGIGTFQTPKGGLNTQIVYVGDGDDDDFKNVDVKGKIVVSNVKFSKIPYGAAKCVSTLFYDPDHTMGFWDEKTNPYSPKTYPYNYDNAMKRGAAGFIGILSDYFDSNQFNNEDYSYLLGHNMKIPGLWVTRKDGETIKKLIKSGKSQANMQMSVTIQKQQAGAVVGLLKGKSDETIMVHSHYDSATPGGTEDASGTSVVLSLAKMYSQIPAEKRDRNILFVLMDTHFDGYDSHDAFIAKYLKPGNKILADTCIEHVAREMSIDDNGRTRMTGRTEPRILFMDDTKALKTITNEEIVRHHLKRTVVLPTWLVDEVPTDADMIHQQGVPIISIITAPIYLYDNCDTTAMIDKEELRPTALTYADIIWRLTKLPVAEFK